jgi:hypothetical protein
LKSSSHEPPWFGEHNRFTARLGRLSRRSKKQAIENVSMNRDTA